ncbi:hypothetical protein HYH03_017152 [Edaphochlamys debaryana]|uniref:Uncharacterized protein n=1 Tax=Edaphochlamys debaryana TaxID=47281 RepID=A0A836BPE0_9CHLO|nr:hypothetical protein HYH03_017152 [Edaphochlamys debaryana]|eukprot:KAG2483985.1 hypothetical protein HYH03_017152 [Edaphochlamys debaryana]
MAQALQDFAKGLEQSMQAASDAAALLQQEVAGNTAAIQLLQQMQQQMQQAQQIQQQQVQQIAGNVAQIQADLLPLKYASARSSNAMALYEEPLVPVPTAAGPIPPGFPATANALHRLNGAQVDNLLRAYGLATTDELEVRRNRLAHHVGVGLRQQ